MVLALIRDQKQQLEDLSFELYGNGLTTTQIGSVMKNIYGKHYSKQVISNITSTFYNQMELWREHSLDTTYLAVYIDAIHLKVSKFRSILYFIWSERGLHKRSYWYC